jgi:hypothetical protein
MRFIQRRNEKLFYIYNLSLRSAHPCRPARDVLPHAGVLSGRVREDGGVRRHLFPAVLASAKASRLLYGKISLQTGGAQRHSVMAP